MSKVTSKLQLTLPKALAEQYRIAPGDEVTWLPAGESLRLVPARAAMPKRELATRLKQFDAATARQKVRDRRRDRAPSLDRGWTRDELYRRHRHRQEPVPRMKQGPR